MGWSGGNEIVSRVAKVAEKGHGGDEDAYCLARAVIAEVVNACRDHDADNLYELESEGPILDEVLREAGVIGRACLECEADPCLCEEG